MIFGYARVSTKDQNLDAQIDALTAAGAVRIFQEKITGKVRQRPELKKMHEQLRDGDVVVITKYDHVHITVPDLCGIPGLTNPRGATCAD